MMTYSDETPLGLTTKTGMVTQYISWKQFADMCRTKPSASKDDFDKPGVTYKYDLGQAPTTRRREDIRGKRSPYVVIDVDFDEKANNLIKKTLRSDNPEAFDRVQEDLDLIISSMAPDMSKVMLLKRSNSGTGFHMVLRCSGWPDDTDSCSDAENAFFDKVDAVMRDIEYNVRRFSFKYSVDHSLKSGTRVVYHSYDPHLIFNEDAPPVVDMSSVLVSPPQEHHSERATPDDTHRQRFEQLARTAYERKHRFQWEDLVRLTHVYFAFWNPDQPSHHNGCVCESCSHFYKHIRMLNHGRAESKSDSERTRRDEALKLLRDGRRCYFSNALRRVGITTFLRYYDELCGEEMQRFNYWKEKTGKSEATLADYRKVVAEFWKNRRMKQKNNKN